MKKHLIRTAAALMAALMLLLSLASCASKGKTLLTLNKDGIKVTFSVNSYELLLSRMKGALAASGYTVNGNTADKDSFWDYQDKFNGTDLQTLNEYYAGLILDNCRTYVAAMWLFEQKGLTVTNEQKENAKKRAEDAMEAHGNGSKTKFNALLSNYGINYDILCDIYLMEEKLTAVQTAMYGTGGSLIGTTVKDEFLAENYVHFKQIFLPYFRYVYTTDKNGDVIYYVKESQTGAICYDTVNGHAGVKDDGTPVTDSNGDQVYYTTSEQTRIAYDMKNGVPSYVTDSDGTAKTEDLTKEELEALKTRADALYESLRGCSAAEFEAAIAKENDNSNSEEIYTDGYYLSKTVDYAGAGSDFAYFTDIINAMDSMEDGDIVKITSDASGYHIIMKYAPTPEAYNMEVNAPWFQDFSSALVESLFLAECQKLYPDIALDEKVLASASDIKRIGVNFYF